MAQMVPAHIKNIVFLFRVSLTYDIFTRSVAAIVAEHEFLGHSEYRCSNSCISGTRANFQSASFVFRCFQVPIFLACYRTLRRVSDHGTIPHES